ncbi:SRPBCC domain-containing protein [Streptomyces sp. WI03-4A]|uniref:SRPBCC family protein n=1 Tax=Streptomyces sp. WI03-4A TaxID=3028706 RepID=UPI0029B80DA4|nr:SRPBCC family protein [Streptomyces sp. WI03-4A]MDX2596181.1 SRPBCC domain-containing protein [Streptomyces sp. WI03-4A]
MEHQVFVPVPADRLREALADPARVARAVPGLQQDAGAEPVTGRLKLRVGGHSVTYRGAVRLTPRADGTYAVDGEAAEARGTGTVKLALTLRLTDGGAAGGDGGDGTTVTVEGTADADGRIAELPSDAVHSAVTRLLSRFLENLSESRPDEDGPDSEANPDGQAAPDGQAGGDGQAAGQADSEAGSVSGSASGRTPDTGHTVEPDSEPDSAPPPGTGPGSEGESGPSSVFDTDVPPPSLDREADPDTDRRSGFDATGEPPAEAAHARRTMIGRSAEEVDHAPPRGRYAPVPAPQTVAGKAALRWAAPAAALAVASAIVLGRALRRRHP